MSPQRCPVSPRRLTPRDFPSNNVANCGAQLRFTSWRRPRDLLGSFHQDAPPKDTLFDNRYSGERDAPNGLPPAAQVLRATVTDFPRAATPPRDAPKELPHAV
jgi:hypothetical protein